MNDTITQSIDTLEIMSQEMERLANVPSNYNTQMGYYLEQMSWEMYRMKNELKGQLGQYGDLQ